jgi:hypothetical protein
MRRFSSTNIPTLAIGAALVPLLALPATAQVSTWCSKFDHTSATDRLKVVAIQVKPTGGARDNELASKFRLSDTLQRILTRAGSSQTPADLLATLIESMRPTAGDERQPFSELRMKLDARPAEAALTPAGMLASSGNQSMSPVGFFNRFDQTQLGKGGHCGEARIVYTKAAQEGGRLLIILEGKVTPAADDEADVTERDCRPVAEFWASLKEKSGADRAKALHDFYFDGDMGALGRLPTPPMSFENLGGSSRGQVRGNLFVNNNTWQLREWLLRKHILLKDGTVELARLSFDLTTVKDNPLAEFYDSSKSATGLEPIRHAAETAGFQSAFERAMLKSLTANGVPNEGAVGALSPAIKAVHGFNFGAGLTSRFDEFQSTSQGMTDIVKLDAAFAGRVEQARQTVGTTLTSNEIVNRSLALTCQGCHQPSGVTRDPGFKLSIAPGIDWPASLDFVHIDEDSNLSPALLESFIPFRAAMLKDHLCTDMRQPALRPMASAPAGVPSGLSVKALSRSRDTAATAAEKSALQETINQQELTNRRSERSQPGSLWTFRRTH